MTVKTERPVSPSPVRNAGLRMALQGHWWAMVLALSACAAYEPPKPGTHRAPGEPVAETTCEYQIPTASRFMTMRCQKTEDAARRGELAREGADAIRMPAPVIKP